MEHWIEVAAKDLRERKTMKFLVWGEKTGSHAFGPEVWWFFFVLICVRPLRFRLVSTRSTRRLRSSLARTKRTLSIQGKIAKRFRTKGFRMLIIGFQYLMSCAFSSTPRFSRLLTSMMIPTSNAGVLQVQMANHQAFSLTIVIPCYMPNEEEIILAVLDFDE